MFICVVGAIGAGKTELIRAFNKDHSDFKVIFESVDKWQEDKVLENYYEDPVRNAFCFQLRVFDDYVESIQENIPKGSTENVIVERSMYCQPLFWAVQTKTNQEDIVYRSMWKKWNEMIPAPTHYIFLDPLATDTLMDRVKERGRKGEENLQRSYEDRLIHEHRAFYHHENPNGLFDEDNLLVLQAEDTIENHVKNIKTWLKL